MMHVFTHSTQEVEAEGRDSPAGSGLNSREGGAESNAETQGLVSGSFQSAYKQLQTSVWLQGNSGPGGRTRS